MNRIAQYLDQPLPIVPSNEHRCYDANGNVVPSGDTTTMLSFDGRNFDPEAPLRELGDGWDDFAPTTESIFASTNRVPLAITLAACLLQYLLVHFDLRYEPSADEFQARTGAGSRVKCEPNVSNGDTKGNLLDNLVGAADLSIYLLATCGSAHYSAEAWRHTDRAIK